MKNHYETLGVPADVTFDELKRVHRKLNLELHPDTNSDPEATEKCKEVNAAYDVLGDPQKRAEHDTELDRQAQGKTWTRRAFAPTFSKNPARRPLPPHLSRTDVDFELVEGDSRSLPQMHVRITNPNNNPNLRPVLQPSTGPFWWTQLYVDGGRSYFSISPNLSDVGPGIYGDSLEVHWEGIPDLTTTLNISLTITPKPPDPFSHQGATGNTTSEPVGEPAQQSLFTSQPNPRPSLFGVILLLLLGLAFLIGPPLLSQLPYFQQASSSPNPGRDVAAVLLFLVWLGGSGGCFYGVYRLIDEWRSSSEKHKRQRLWLARLFTGSRRARAMSILALICLVVPPAVVLPLYLSRHNLANDFNTVVIVVLLGLLFLVGTPAFLYEARKARKAGR